MAKKKTAQKAKKMRPARRQGPAAAAKADKKKTARGRPGGKRPGEDERIAYRRSRAITARIQGGTYRQIATENECSVGTAFEDVAAELAAICKSTRLEAEHLRALALERCDLVLRGFKAESSTATRHPVASSSARSRRGRSCSAVQADPRSPRRRAGGGRSVRARGRDARGGARRVRGEPRPGRRSGLEAEGPLMAVYVDYRR